MSVFLTEDGKAYRVEVACDEPGCDAVECVEQTLSQRSPIGASLTELGADGWECDDPSRVSPRTDLCPAHAPAGGRHG